MSGEPWPLRWWSAFRGRTQPPLRVEPKHRISGPREVPSDWWTEDGQKRITAQCALCHEHVLPGKALQRGLCGPCYLRTSTDTPEAA